VLLVVSTRVVIMAGVAFLYFSIGAGWLGVTTTQSSFSYNALGITGRVGPFLTTGVVPVNSTEDGQIWNVLLPLFVSSVPSLLAGAVFLAAVVLSVVSFFRWRLMLVAGILGILSGFLWIWGIGMISQSASSGISALCQFQCNAARSSAEIYPQVGAYLAVFGGLILVLGFALSVFEKLEYPLD
jgi:hypothetical protein